MQKTKKNTKKVRLPVHIKPSIYDLRITPDLEAFVFTGTETIKAITDKEINKITLHAKDIEILEASVLCNKKTQASSKIEYNTKNETVTITFKEKIPKSKIEISLNFKGVISDTLRGFYKSSYVLDGEKKHIATTQFEATDARRCFPCFDEPAQKAIFNVELIVPNNHTAISNTLPTEIREHNSGFKIIKFAPTPSMSTYLLAFIIGEFEFIEGKTKDGVQIRVFTTLGKKHQAKFSLDVAIKCLEFYNEYFDIPYPLPILDLVAIPDFESAAMENWGAITFRETALLVDEDHSSFSNKQWVAIVIAHEIAHQWFGNLVTMHWWTDLWLNEGFASYMENLCIDAIFPEWKVWDLNLSDRYQVALKLDSLANSHAIEVKVNHPDGISEIFDMVSYAKGSAIIKQLAYYIGHNNFRDGLRHYLKKHSYKNTNTVDLWDSFEKKSGKPVKKIMKNWTSKTGYPLVTLIKEKNNYKLKQERFFSSRISAKNNTEKTIWDIPIIYESNKEVLKTLATKKVVPLIGTEIGKINVSENSFIRVAYNKETLDRLFIEIKENKLDVRDRLGIVRDLFALSEGGYIKSTEALEFALNYRNESEYIVWSEISTGFTRVYSIVLEKSDEKTKELYRKYALKLFSPLARKMSFTKKKDEKHSDVFLRNLGLSMSAFYGDKETIKEAQKIFKERGSKKIDADIRSVIYNIIARDGKNKDWEIFKKMYLNEKLHEEKDRLARALTYFNDKVLIEKTLNFIISKEVRDQDAPHLIASMWLNSKARNETWSFVKKNWPVLLKKYGEGGHFLSRMLSPLGSHTNTKDANDIKKFFAKNKAPGSERTLEQSYEKIYSNEAWIKSDKKIVEKWLTKNID